MAKPTKRQQIQCQAALNHVSIRVSLNKLRKRKRERRLYSQTKGWSSRMSQEHRMTLW
jgi:hypothetical protein